MIEQDLIDRCEALISFSGGDCDLLSLIDDMNRNMVELLDNYKKLIESNAELHKDLVKVRVK